MLVYDEGCLENHIVDCAVLITVGRNLPQTPHTQLRDAILEIKINWVRFLSKTPGSGLEKRQTELSPTTIPDSSQSAGAVLLAKQKRQRFRHLADNRKTMAAPPCALFSNAPNRVALEIDPRSLARFRNA